jgi:hypothetical protein
MKQGGLFLALFSLAACGRHTVEHFACLTNADCIDEDYCNGVERCVNHRCVPGIPPDCSDGIACTDDYCSPRTNRCEHAADDRRCDDGIACTSDTCGASGCENVPDDTRCDDGKLCNGAERCQAGVGCVPGAAVVCTPTRACEVAACDEAAKGCVTTFVDADGDGHAAMPCGDDCDDADPSVHPGALDVCNGKDDNCNGWVDEDRVVSQRQQISGRGIPFYWTPGIAADADGGFLVGFPEWNCQTTPPSPALGYTHRTPTGDPAPAGSGQVAAQPDQIEGGVGIVPRPGGGFLVGVNAYDASTASLNAAVVVMAPGMPPVVSVLPVAVGQEPRYVELATDGQHVLVHTMRSGETLIPVDADGAPLGPAVTLAGGSSAPLSFDAGSGLFQRLTQEEVGGQLHTFVERYDASGAWVGKLELLLPLGVENDVFLFWMGKHYLAVWWSSGALHTMVFSPTLQPGPPHVFYPVQGGSHGIAVQRGDEVVVFTRAHLWSGPDPVIESSAFLLDADGEQRAPEIPIVGPNELYWEMSAGASATSYALVSQIYWGGTGTNSPCPNDPSPSGYRPIGMWTLSCP